MSRLSGRPRAPGESRGGNIAGAREGMWLFRCAAAGEREGLHCTGASDCRVRRPWPPTQPGTPANPMSLVAGRQPAIRPRSRTNRRYRARPRSQCVVSAARRAGWPTAANCSLRVRQRWMLFGHGAPVRPARTVIITAPPTARPEPPAPSVRPSPIAHCPLPAARAAPARCPGIPFLLVRRAWLVSTCLRAEHHATERVSAWCLGRTLRPLNLSRLPSSHIPLR